jgi:DNA-binding transcriptional MerR regulator
MGGQVQALPLGYCTTAALPLGYRNGGRQVTEVRLSFKEMCARFDVTPRTLRYYEYIELLDPEKDGRARFYGAREVARMTLILRGRRFGFSLEEIRQWLLIYRQQGTKPQLETWLQMADRQLAALDAQRAELDSTIADLRALRDASLGDLTRTV